MKWLDVVFGGCFSSGADVLHLCVDGHKLKLCLSCILVAGSYATAYYTGQQNFRNIKGSCLHSLLYADFKVTSK